MSNKLYDIWENGFDSIYYDKYKQVLSCSILNAKYLFWSNRLTKLDGNETMRSACGFCGLSQAKTMGSRYFFDGQVFYVNGWCSGQSRPYFMCVDALEECVKFGEQYMLVSYILNTFCDIDIKNIIMNLYYVGLQHARSRCVIMGWEEACKDLIECIKKCDKIDNLTIKELRYFMTLNNISYPGKGTGKYNGVVKIDYINKIKIECGNKKIELEQLEITLHNYQRKLI